MWCYKMVEAKVLDQSFPNKSKQHLLELRFYRPRESDSVQSFAKGVVAIFKVKLVLLPEGA